MFTLEKLGSHCFVSSSDSLAKKFCIAYSGGLDSHVLLHAMAALCAENKYHFSLRAAHIHHGFSSNADQWAAHCQIVCDQLSIPLVVKKINIELTPGDSLEEKARNARYTAFQALLTPEEKLLTAHTADDQAETILLQLLRGAGVKGLSAMPAIKNIGTGFLQRPLLNFTRADLLQYAIQHGLKWIEDESNQELRFNRNYLRHQVLPILRQRWPECAKTLSRAAAHCAEANELLDVLADQDLSCDLLADHNRLSIDHLQLLSPPRRRNVLRRWIQRQGCRLPNRKHLEQIWKEVACASVAASPLFSWDQAEIRRIDNYLCLNPIAANRF